MIAAVWVSSVPWYKTNLWFFQEAGRDTVGSYDSKVSGSHSGDESFRLTLRMSPPPHPGQIVCILLKSRHDGLVIRQAGRLELLLGFDHPAVVVRINLDELR